MNAIGYSALSQLVDTPDVDDKRPMINGQIQAGEMSNSSSQVKMSAEDLSKLAGKLKEIVHKFKV